MKSASGQRYFLATTWDEINMLAQNNEYLQEAVSGVRQLTAEEQIRQQCQAGKTISTGNASAMPEPNV